MDRNSIPKEVLEKCILIVSGNTRYKQSSLIRERNRYLKKISPYMINKFCTSAKSQSFSILVLKRSSIVPDIYSH